MFNKLNISYFSTSLGYWVSLFFIPVMVLKMTNSALLVSITYVLDVLPYIILTPIAGVVGDKMNKKHLVLLGEFICFITSLFLLVITFEESSVFLVLLIGFVISAFSAIHHPLFQSILPELYRSEKLAEVNANIATINSLTGIIAPSVLGGLFLFLDDKQIAMIIPALYLLSFSCFYFIKYQYDNTMHGDVNILSDLNDAFVFLKSKKMLLDFSNLFFFVNFGLKFVFVGLIWIYSNQYNLSSEQIAYNFIFIGVMSILGAKIAGKYIVNKFSADKIIFYSCFAIAGSTIMLIFVRSFIFLTIVWGLVSFFSMFIVVAYFTYRQQIVPKLLLSRVISLTRLISYLAIPPSALLSGYLLELYGNENIIYIISSLFILFPTALFYFRWVGAKDN